MTHVLQVRLCLVINKMDRLILELGLSPQEAYTRLKGIITHVNMIVSAFQSEQHISEADAVLAHEDAKATLDDRWHLVLPAMILYGLRYQFPVTCQSDCERLPERAAHIRN